MSLMPAPAKPSTGSRPKVIPVLNAPLTIEAAPEQRVVFLDEPVKDQRYGVFEWQRLGDGTYAPVVRVYDAHVRMATAAQIADLTWETIRRLILAEFVDGSQPSPGVILVSVNSLIEHLRATRDPDFWTESRRRKYHSALR